MAKLKSPKAKGDAYERELAAYLNEQLASIRLAEMRRAPLSGGGFTASGFDLDGTRIEIGGETWELGIEAKRFEKVNIWECLAQNEKHRSSFKDRHFDISRLLPVVVSRRNNMATGSSLVALRLDDFCCLLTNRPIHPTGGK